MVRHKLKKLSMSMLHYVDKANEHSICYCINSKIINKKNRFFYDSAQTDDAFLFSIPDFLFNSVGNDNFEGSH
jgi:hypothetical protein